MSVVQQSGFDGFVRVAALVGAGAFLAFFLTLDRTPVVWGDETFFASTAYSLITDGSGVPTAMSEDLRVPREPLFHGPVFFALGAASFRMFGFSIRSFRLVSLLGALVLAFGSALLTRRVVGTSRSAILCFALVALSPQTGAMANSGRMDALAVGLQMTGLALLIAGIQSSGSMTWLGYSVSAGLIWSLAVLTTPRSLLFFVATAIACLIFLKTAATMRRRAFSCISFAGISAAAVVTGWTATQGITPFSWLAYIASISARDKGKFSALFSGVWRLHALTDADITFVGMGLIVAVLAWVAAGRKEHSSRDTTVPRFVWIALITNALASWLFISVSQTYYSVYWLMPLLPIAVAQSVILLADRQVPPARKSVLTYVWICLMISFLAVRAAKYVELSQSWNARSPASLEAFAKTNIPPGSEVFGLPDYYFYAVEQAGASYRYAQPFISAGKLEDTANPLLKAERERRRASGVRPRFERRFILWPADRALPDEFQCASQLVTARFQPPAQQKSWLSGYAKTTGYPATTLYQFPPDCRSPETSDP